MEKILLAAPRGFCAGVDRAIEIVEKALEIFGKPVYMRHQIVHNEHVVSRLEDLGAIFVEELHEIPDGSTVILSAHGVSPQVREEAKERGFRVIDATCPLVTKVHFEAIAFHKKGFEIILIGHKGHQEVVGTMGEAPMYLVETAEDVAHLEVKNPEKVACLTQTTLSIDDTAEIMTALRAKFPNLTFPPKEDICYATTNRQNAVKAMAEKTDLVLVVGSVNSSNSNRLVDTAKRYGVDSYLIPDAGSIQDHWLTGVEVMGLTSGASVPDNLVQEVIAKIREISPDLVVEEFLHTKEDVEFRLPYELKPAVAN